jgi:esterase/lipase superfamily enzyme
VGRDDPLRGESERLSGVLWDKGIGNALRLWDGWAHDWPYWPHMLRCYIGGHD